MPSNGYCEGQTLNRIIPKTIIAALTGKRIQLQGGGVAKKSYLHADDISSAIILCMEKGAIGETYNCGPVEAISIYNVVDFIAEKMGTDMDALTDEAPERVGQDSMYLLNSGKIKKLGWRQSIWFDEGLDRMIAWVRKYPELLTMDQGYTHRP